MFKFWSLFQIQNLWYSFTRYNSFLKSPFQSLPEKQKNSSLNTSKHINSNLNVYLFLDSKLQLGKSIEFSNEWMKVQVKRAWRSYFFVTKKVIKKQTSSAWNFLQPSMQVCRGAYIPCFSINALIFCCPFFYKE